MATNPLSEVPLADVDTLREQKIAEGDAFLGAGRAIDGREAPGGSLYIRDQEAGECLFVHPIQEYPDSAAIVGVVTSTGIRRCDGVEDAAKIYCDG